MLYNNFSTAYVSDGISKAESKFLMMGSFPEVLSNIYYRPAFVATCGWLADRRGYITSRGMMVDLMPTLFKQYGNENALTDTVKLDQRIFDLTTNWVIYSSFDDMATELGWYEED